KRDRDENADVCFVGERLQHIDVAANQSRFGYDANWITKLSTDFETLSRQFVIRFERNVRVGGERKNDLLALPGRLHQFFAQQRWGIDLNYDLALKVRAGPKIQILMRRPAETVRASVNASAIAVD